MSRATITISHSRSRDTSASSRTSDEEGTASSPVEVSSASPLAGSQDYSEGSDGDWDRVGEDEVEPSDSVSLPSSSKDGRRLVEAVPPPARHSSSRQRTDSERHHHRPRRSDREPGEHREHREPREHREHRSHRHHRRRDPSVQSDSVGSHEEYGGYPHRPYPPGQQPHPHPQWAYISRQQSAPQGPPSSVGSQPAYNPFTNPGPPPPPPPGQQLVHYASHDPFAYASPMYASPPPSLPHSNSSGYFSPHMQHPPHVPHPPPHTHAPQYPMGMMPYSHGMPYYPPYGMHPGMISPPRSSVPDDDDQVTKLKELIVSQEAQRVAREKERELKAEAEKRAREAAMAKEAADKQAAENIAAATKKAKEEAETEAAKKAKEAKEAHDKALAEAKEAEEKAKTAETAAKEEAKKHKPSEDDGKAPIKFKDAVGRKFVFPWKICKTWKGMEELIRQAFLHVDVIGQHVQDGHYDLMGPNGEIILPQVWENTVAPDWSITMHMWPMTEEKKEEAPPPPPPAPAAPPAPVKLDFFGRPKKTSSKSSKQPRGRPTSMVGLPPPPPPGASAAPPPRPPSAGAAPAPAPSAAAPAAPPGVEVVTDRGKKKSKQPLPPLLAWTAGGSVRDRSQKRR